MNKNQLKKLKDPYAELDRLPPKKSGKLCKKLVKLLLKNPTWE